MPVPDSFAAHDAVPSPADAPVHADRLLTSLFSLAWLGVSIAVLAWAWTPA